MEYSNITRPDLFRQHWGHQPARSFDGSFWETLMSSSAALAQIDYSSNSQAGLGDSCRLSVAPMMDRC